MLKAPVIVDFETEAIDGRPAYPPRPVGVALWAPGGSPHYLAWGHPTGNNCDEATARKFLLDVWSNPRRQVVFHNAKFDLDVAQTHLQLPMLPWERIHDTLFLLFLRDPHAPSLSLKPAAERWLGMPPDERDLVAQWLTDHGVIRRGQSPGPYICRAPGDVVGQYAVGDVVRTKFLWDSLLKQLDARELVAYNRERKLLGVLLENERRGIRFDVDLAEQQLPIYEAALATTEKWLRERLGVGDINFDADAQVADALSAAGVVTEWAVTKTGRRSTAKANMGLDRFADPQVFQALGYRNRLQTVLSINLRPWLEGARAGGRVFTEWNQVRHSAADGSRGTRTGRLSCSKFQNISKAFGDKGDGYTHPTFLGVPPLPHIRRYLLPEPGHVFVHRDYNQQEFRILAHFEDDALRASYQENPRTDYHTLMRARIQEIAGLDYDRRLVKVLNFGILYGMGVGLLAQSMRVPVEVATQLRDAARFAAPGVALLNQELKRRAREGQHVRTWGGRKYYCEPPAFSKKHGREMTFEYKLLNYLVQGSAADCTKQALINYDVMRREGTLLVTVHDEINLSVPEGAVKEESERLREAMESVEFTVPMLTDAKSGPSWGDLT